MKEQTGHYRITDIDESDRPRERLMKVGAENLSTAELLAILLRVGTKDANAITLGQNLINKMDGLVGLHRAPIEDLTNINGIGLAKAAQIKAAIELGHRISIAEPGEKTVINSPSDAAALVQYQMSALEVEELRVILLDTRNRVQDVRTVCAGSVNQSQVRVSEVFRDAVRNQITSIILVHNHPSGDATPSPDDVSLTRAIVQAGKLLDIQVLDHIIIGRKQHVSLKERGLGFS